MTAPRVLVVDDNAMNLEMASFLLGADGWEVLALSDIHEALARVAAFGPDVVLMDIQLPGIDGLQATRLLKADPATQRICVIAFTAYAMKGDNARMRAAGCDGYISKPIEVTSFAAEVRSCLERHRRA